MAYAISGDMKTLIERLHDLRTEVEWRASLMSAAAQEEWQKVKSRIPTNADIGVGFASASEEELVVLTSKVSRLTQLLRTLEQRDGAGRRQPG
jgi:hypothetical protein